MHILTGLTKVDAWLDPQGQLPARVDTAHALVQLGSMFNPDQITEAQRWTGVVAVCTLTEAMWWRRALGRRFTVGHVSDSTIL